MKRRDAVLLISSGACGLAAAAQPPKSPFAFRDASPASLELTENGRPVFVYNHGMLLPPGVDPKYRRSSYLHPIHAPDGTVLTDDFPKDHPHHRGLCWTWPEVTHNGVTHDIWAVVGMEQRFGRWLKRETQPGRAVLAIENGWYAMGSDVQVVKETVGITVLPAAGNRRTFDVALTFEALKDRLTISGREKKGYGGFGVRFAPRTDTVLRTDSGVEPKDTDMVPHPWAELEATFANGRRAGLRIEDQPTNPGRFPVGWCLRHYGYVAANYPGLEKITLAPGKPLKLNYRVTVFSAT